MSLIAHFLCPSVHPSIHPSIYPSICLFIYLSIHCAPHLRNHKWQKILPSTVHILGTIYDMMIIYGTQIVSGVKGQKMVQNDKNSAFCTPYLKNHTLYDFHFWCTCVKWYLFDAFSVFSKFWFSGLLGG